MPVLHFPTTGIPPDATTGTDPQDPAVDPSGRRCQHQCLEVGPLEAELCPATNELTWLSGGEILDPAEALAKLFGNFDLVTTVDGLRAPGPVIFVYRPTNRMRRSWMRSLPEQQWMEAAPGLWITHDRYSLLMTPDDPVLAANLLRREGVLTSGS